MTGLNPSSADGARPRPALLVAGQEPASFRLTTFPNDEGYDEMVLARVPASLEPM
jgi:hypothetical protein